MLECEQQSVQIRTLDAFDAHAFGDTMNAPTDTLRSIKIKARNYKCFGSEAAGFDTLRAVNLVVGRNNSGKSALLDLVGLACNHGGVPPALDHQGNKAVLLLTTPLTKDLVRAHFSPNNMGGDLGGNHWEFAKPFVGTEMTVEVYVDNKTVFHELHTTNDYAKAKRIFQGLAQNASTPFRGRTFARLLADRDIGKEQDTTDLKITSNGSGFTNVIQNYINRSDLPNALIDRQLLPALNSIFKPDARFSAIEVQRHDGNFWEVYIEEDDKGPIALGHSGSGLKTVLLVLGYVILLPVIQRKNLSEFVFAFEELENNLHPALQRRLVGYLREIAVKHGCPIFLTSHSSAVIDLLSKDEHAQLLHVTHNGTVAKVRHVTTYYDGQGVLDDLDIRASDLLQANGIVWVEGPSDRLYFNRWIELATGGKLREGTHYQCVFYGGRLLAHLSGEAPFDETEQSELVKVFAVNRNAIILIDSDKNYANRPLNDTKKRVVQEFEGLDCIAWVTKGREVENYLPEGLLAQVYPGLHGGVGQYDDITEVLEKHEPGAGKDFARNKVLAAERFLPHITLDDITKTLDLGERLQKVCAEIASWNGISPSGVTQ